MEKPPAIPRRLVNLVRRWRRRRTLDHAATAALIGELRRARRVRQPFFLTLPELTRLLRWKFGPHWRGVHRRILTDNTPARVRAATVAAFRGVPDPAATLAPLCALRGVSVTVASALATLCYPEHFAIIDYRVWRVLAGHGLLPPTARLKRSSTIPQFVRYTAVMRALARAARCTPQQADWSLWAYDLTRDRARW